MTTDRFLPPQSIEAEMSILGGMFVDNDIIDAVQGAVKVSDFYRESHRVIFTAMGQLANRNEPTDLITMSTELKNSGNLERVGGAAFLAVLVNYVPMAANTLHYCRIVAQKARERKLILEAQGAIQIIINGGEYDDAVARLEAATMSASNKRIAEPVRMDQSVREACKKLEHRYENKGKVQGIPYGLDELDKKTSGMHPGELIIVAGRPSMGKSAFAGNVIKNACLNHGKSGMLFTLEMERSDVTDRFIASEGIKYHLLRNGCLREQDWSEISKAVAKLHEIPLFIDDTPAISIKDVRARARRQKKAAEGLDLLVIDYLQLMSLPNSKDSRVHGLGEITRGLKQLARELEIPAILLSQLSRSVDTRQDTRPTMSDLRDSGEIEQDADVILFPYRPAAYCKKCRDRVYDAGHNYREHQAEAEIIIEKQRAGERNVTVPACWIGEYQKFEGI